MKHSFSLVEPSHIVAHSSRRRGSMQGFSLVELSIVLVILGLLTGGILTGQSLIRAAELRTITTEFNNYQTAMMTFRGKYFALPGDMKNAVDFWGSAGGDDSITGTCAAQTGTGTQTCNGTGDSSVWQNGGAGAYGEYFTFWQHLSNAGLIEGSYTGINGSTGSNFDAVIGTNVPPSRLANAGWFIGNPITASAVANYFDGQYPHRLMIGSKTANGATDAPTLTTEEAWNIDKKIDDSKPGSGKLISYKNTSTATPGCTTTDDPATAEYALTASGTLCSIQFLLKL